MTTPRIDRSTPPVRGFIYLIVAKYRNGPIYVGQTVRLSKRFKWHKSRLLNGKHDNSWLQRAVAKHGIGSFEFMSVEDAPLDDLSNREQAWIDALRVGRCCVCNFGAATAPRAGMSFSPEHRAKLREAWTRRGPVSDETKRKISIAHKGRPGRVWSNEQREAFSAMMLAHPTRLGAKHTEETKQKMRDTWAAKRAEKGQP